MRIFQLALRSLSYFRVYTWINVLGLTLSLTCVILISRYVYSEWSTDHFNTKLDKLCLVTFEYQKGLPEVRMGNLRMTNRTKDVAIEKEAVFSVYEKTITCNNQAYDTRIISVDTVFLQLMDFPIEVGNRNTLFKNPNGIAITRNFANRLFGKENPIGKSISLSNDKHLTVEAIIGKTSSKSSLSFDMMIPVDSDNDVLYSLVLLSENARIEDLNKRWSTPVETVGFGGMTDEILFQYFPLKKIYYNTSVITFDNFSRGNYTNTWVLLMAAILILLVGLFNYVNIYTLIQQKRNREFGLKKVFGSGVRHIVGQLFIENFILITIALFFSWILVELGSRLLQSFFGLSQVVRLSFDCLLSVGILLILPLVVSVYPFFKYLSMPTIASLRSSLLGGKAGIGRPVFLVFQYIVSIVLIVASLFLVKQLNYMLHADMGFRTKDIIAANFITPKLYEGFTGSRAERQMDERRRLEQISQQMNQSTLFTHWQYANSPDNLGRFHTRLSVNGNDFVECIYQGITNSYLELYDIQLLEGRFWDDTEGSVLPVPIVINEKAKNALGITDIHTMSLYSSGLTAMSETGPVTNPSVQIIGVIKDFHIDHLSKAVPPIAFVYSERGFSHYATLSAAIAPGKREEAIRFLNQLHDEVIGGDFSYKFVEDGFSVLYEEDRKITTIYSIFALIAICISAMGLFGLSLFDIQQRYKEIAIRKVNGATIPVIMKLLLTKYAKLLLIAFVIAVPVSWLAVTRYLEDFAFKAPISWWLFTVALFITVTISLLTLSWQIRKASQLNPAEAIKTE